MAGYSYVRWVLDGPTKISICAFVVIVNILFLMVLCRREMRSVTSFLLSAIAACDTLMVISAFPYSVYLSVTDFEKPIPYSWCPIVVYRGVVAQISHTASMWLTVTLGVFRYISVCYPLKAPAWCSAKRAGITSIIIIVLPIVIYGSNFFHTRFEPETLKFANTSVKTCKKILNDWYIPIQRQYDLGFFIFRSIFIQFIPCSILMIITIRLLYVLKIASKRRSNALGTNQPDRTGSKRRNFLLITVLIATVIIEVPLALIMVLNAVDGYMIKFDTFVFVSASNDVLLLTCAFNFCIHCTMGKKFRKELRELCCCRSAQSMNYTQ